MSADLSQLFDTDPRQLTQDDISAIITHMRASRHQFNAGNAKAGSTKPKSEKEKTISALADKLGLGDL